MRRDGASLAVRGASALIALAMVLAGVPAPGAATEAPAPGPGGYSANATVNATVVDNYARVAYEVSIDSHGAPVEVPLEVRVPDDAYVSHMALERNGTVHEAHVEPREEARETYEQARDEGRSAGVAEQKREASVYRLAVHVGAGETVNATLAYETLLAAEQGIYAAGLPAPNLPANRTERLVFDVRLQHVGGLQDVEAEPDANVTREDGAVHVTRSLHAEAGPAANTTVRYRVAETPRHGSLVTHVENGTGYFAHRFRAEDGADGLPLDLSLVLDTSGSMSGMKIDQLRRAGTGVLEALDPDDRVALVPFDSRTQPTWEGLRAADAANVQAATDAVQGLRADGSTHLEDALETGLGALEGSGEERAPVLAFLTDGHATSGAQATDRLRAIASEANTVGADVYTLAFGPQADWPLVHGLAQDGDGTAVQVAPGQGAREDIQRFLTALTSPVLTDVSIAYEGNVTPVHDARSTLFAGSEMVVVGTFDPAMDEVEANVSARTGNATQNWTVREPVLDDEHPYLPRLVGYHELKALEDRIAAEGGNETLEDRARELALEHGFVTERTSLVLTLPRELPANATADGNTTEAADGANATIDLSTDDAQAVPEGDLGSAPSASTGGGGGAPAHDRDATHGGDGGHGAEQPQAETPAPGALALAGLVAALALVVRRR